MTEYRLDLSGMRVGYRGGIPPNVGQGDREAGADGVRDNLDPSWLDGNPPWVSLFDTWMAEAVAAQIPEPNAMVLGTVDADGFPATRTVLCKSVDASGVVFYTGYLSQKGQDLASNPVAAVTFPWIALERQVHLRGRVVKTSPAETEQYWNMRPWGSRVSAVASNQSQPIDSREALEAKAAAVAQECGPADTDRPIAVPQDWGGFRIEPTSVEFWQGRANRLHNRVRVTSDAEGNWAVTRLQP